MVNKGPRTSDRDNQYQRKYDEELAANPPVIVWEPKPGNPWIQIAVRIEDYIGKPGRRPEPPCRCNLYGSPKRRRGTHHDADCARSKPW